MLLALNKKGISPFISIILIVALVVAVGVMVVTWSENLTKKTTEDTESKIIQETECKIATDLALWINEGYQQICLDGDDLKFVLENKGANEITNVHVNVLYLQDSISEKLDLGIDAGGVLSSEISLNETDIEQVVFTPAIIIDGNEYWCADNAVQIDGSFVSECET